MIDTTKEIEITPPRLAVTDQESEEIMDELGLSAVREDSDGMARGDARALQFRDILKLGHYVEGCGVIPLDHGAILLARQVMLRHMIRIERHAETVKDSETLVNIGKALGYMGGQIGKVSTIGIRTRVAAEEIAEEQRKKHQPWKPGVPIGPPTPIQVNGDAVFINGTQASPV